MKKKLQRIWLRVLNFFTYPKEVAAILHEMLKDANNPELSEEYGDG